MINGPATHSSSPTPPPQKPIYKTTINNSTPYRASSKQDPRIIAFRAQHPNIKGHAFKRLLKFHNPLGHKTKDANKIQKKKQDKKILERLAVKLSARDLITPVVPGGPARRVYTPKTSSDITRTSGEFPSYSFRTPGTLDVPSKVLSRTWHGIWLPDEHSFLRQLRAECLSSFAKKKSKDSHNPYVRMLLTPARDILDLYNQYRLFNIRQQKKGRSPSKISGRKFTSKFILDYKHSTVSSNSTLTLAKCDSCFVPKGTLPEAFAISNAQGGSIKDRISTLLANWDPVINLGYDVARQVGTNIATDMADRASILINIASAAFDVFNSFKTGLAWSSVGLSLNALYRAFDFTNPWARNAKSVITRAFPGLVTQGRGKCKTFFNYLFANMSQKFRDRFPLGEDVDPVLFQPPAEDLLDIPLPDDDPIFEDPFLPNGFLDSTIDICNSDVSNLLSKITSFVASIFLVFSLKPDEATPTLSVGGLTKFAFTRVVPVVGGALLTAGTLNGFLKELDITLSLLYNSIDAVFRGDFGRFCGINAYDQIIDLHHYVLENYGHIAPSGAPLTYSGRDFARCDVTKRLPPSVYDSSDPGIRDMITTLEGGPTGGSRCQSWHEGNKTVIQFLLRRLEELAKKGTLKTKLAKAVSDMMQSLILLDKETPNHSTSRKAAGITAIICGAAGIGKSHFVSHILTPILWDSIVTQGYKYKYPDVLQAGLRPGQPVPDYLTNTSTLDQNFYNCKKNGAYVLMHRKDDPHPGNPIATGPSKFNVNTLVMDTAEIDAANHDAAAISSKNGDGVKGDNAFRILSSVITDNREMSHLERCSSFLPASVRRCNFYLFGLRDEFANPAGGLDTQSNQTVKNMKDSLGNSALFNVASVVTYVRASNASGEFAMGEPMCKVFVNYTFEHDREYGVGAELVKVTKGFKKEMHNVSMSFFCCYLQDFYQSFYERSFHDYNVRELKLSMTPPLTKCSCAGGSAIMHCRYCAGFAEFCPVTGWIRTTCHHCLCKPFPKDAPNPTNILCRLKRITDLEISYFRVLMYSSTLRRVTKAIFTNLDIAVILMAHKTGDPYAIAIHGGRFVEGGGFTGLLSNAAAMQRNTPDELEDWFAEQFPHTMSLRSMYSLFFAFLFYTPHGLTPLMRAIEDPVMSLIATSQFAAGIDTRAKPLHERLLFDMNPSAVRSGVPNEAAFAEATALSLSKLTMVFSLMDMPQRCTSDLTTSLAPPKQMEANLAILFAESELDLRPDVVSFAFNSYLSDFLYHLAPSYNGISTIRPHVSLNGEERNMHENFDFEDFRKVLNVHFALDPPAVFKPNSDSVLSEEEKSSELSDDESVDTEYDFIGARPVEIPMPTDYADASYMGPAEASRIASDHAAEVNGTRQREDAGRTAKCSDWVCRSCAGVVWTDHTQPMRFFHYLSCPLAMRGKCWVIDTTNLYVLPKHMPERAVAEFQPTDGLVLVRELPNAGAFRASVEKVVYGVRDQIRPTWYASISPEAVQVLTMLGMHFGTAIAVGLLTSIYGRWSLPPEPIPLEFTPHGDAIPTAHGLSEPHWERSTGDAMLDDDVLNRAKKVTSGSCGRTLDAIQNDLLGCNARTKVSRIARITIIGRGQRYNMHATIICNRTFVCPAHFFSKVLPDPDGTYGLEMSILRSDTRNWITHKTTIGSADIAYGSNDLDLVRVHHGYTGLGFKLLNTFFADEFSSRVRLRCRSYHPDGDRDFSVADNVSSNFSPECLLFGPGRLKYGDNVGTTLANQDMRQLVSFASSTPGKPGDCGCPIVFHRESGAFPTLGVYTGTYNIRTPGSRSHEIYVVITADFMRQTQNQLFASTLSKDDDLIPIVEFGDDPFLQRALDKASFAPKMDTVIEYGGASTEQDLALIKKARINCGADIVYHANSRTVGRGERGWHAFMSGQDKDEQCGIDNPLYKFSLAKCGYSTSLPCYDSREVKSVQPYNFKEIKPMRPTMQGPPAHCFVWQLHRLGCAPWMGPKLHLQFDGVLLGTVGPGRMTPEGTEATMNLDSEIAKTFVNAHIPSPIVREAGKRMFEHVKKTLAIALSTANRSDLMACAKTTCADSYNGLRRDDGSLIFQGYDLKTSFGSNNKPMNGSKKNEVVKRDDTGLYLYLSSAASWLAMVSVVFLFTMGIVPPHQYLTCFAKDECYPVTSNKDVVAMNYSADSEEEFFDSMYGREVSDSVRNLPPGVDPRTEFAKVGVVKDKVRLVCVIPGGVNLAFRVFMMPLLYLVDLNPILWDLVAGLDMSGPHFEQSTFEIFKKSYNPVNQEFCCFDADVSAWDKVMPNNLTYETLLIMIQLVMQIHKDLGTYNKQIAVYAGALLKWWSEFELLYKGMLFQVGGMPSGFVLTLIMNGMMNILLLYCVVLEFCRINNVPVPQRISDYVMHKAHGDDSQTAVDMAFNRACDKAGAPRFDCKQYSAILKSWGILSTLGNKSEGDIVFQKPVDLVFLQHTLKYQWIPAWTATQIREIPERVNDRVLIGSAPMKPHTLVKMLATQDDNSSISKPSLLLAQIRTLVYELLPYGRHRVRELERVVRAFSDPVWKPDEAWIEKEYDDIFDWNSALSWYVSKFCEDGVMCPSIVKARADNPHVFAKLMKSIGPDTETTLHYD